MTSRTISIAIVCALLAVLVPLSCAINPVTGKRELMLVTQQDEIALGKQSDQEIGQTYGFYEDAELAAYVDRVGQSVARNTHQPNLEYHFKVLDTPVVNAFAVPGGYVYVTRGILAYLNDEAELAGVIGHELGHENARHIARNMSRQQLAQVGLIAMSVSERLRKYAGLAQFGASMLFLKFSRDDERQADDLAVEYAGKTGYDTYRMAAFFETLERMNAGAGTGLPDWFSTHPNPVNRIAAVRTATAQWQTKLARPQYAVKGAEYLKEVDGIVYGDDPRQGYAEGNAFYHPTLTFAFPIPDGWRVNNTPAQVQLLSGKEDAAIVLMMDKAATPAAAADQFVLDTKAVVQSRRKLTVNGFSAEQVVARLASDSDTLQTMSYFIAKGKTVYAFHGMTARTQYAQYAPTFSKTLGGFRNLDDPAKINVKPERLAVKTAVKGGPASAALKQLGTADKDLEQRSLLNGIHLTDNVAAGTLVKTVTK